MPTSYDHDPRGTAHTLVSPGWSLTRWGALLAAVAVTFLLTLSPALGADPLNLPDELVDEVGAVDDEAVVRAAQDRLHAETGLQLYVVFVDDFGGLSGWEWADQTAAESHLGEDDLLLAVATEERSWGLSVSEGTGISVPQEDRVVSRIENELRDSDWDGAAMEAANGFADVLAADAGPDEGDSSRTALWVGVGIVGIGATVVGAPWVRRSLADRRRREEEFAELTATSEEVGGQLVALDNVLAASETELQYAEAEFAPELTRPFRQAVEESRAESVEAYRMREQIGEVTEDTVHARAAEKFRALQALIERADTRLDEHTAAFNDLRRLADRAPQRIKELATGIAAANRTLDDTELLLATRTDLRAGQRDQFGDLIAACRGLLAQGNGSVEVARERLRTEGPEDAVLPIKAAEQALSEVTAQAELLRDIDVLVANWHHLLEEARASLTGDVADAERLAPQDAAVGALVATARTVLGRVSDTAEDPVDLADELGEVERALDASLAGYRAAEEKHLKAVARAESQQRRTEARIKFMESDMQRVWARTPASVRRNAQAARERLAEGVALAQSDPEAAERTLQQASSLADAVARALPSLHVETSSTGSGWGGSSSSSRSSFSSSRRSSRSHSSSSSSRRSSSRSSSRSRSSSSSRRSRGGRF